MSSIATPERPARTRSSVSIVWVLALVVVVWSAGLVQWQGQVARPPAETADRITPLREKSDQEQFLEARGDYRTWEQIAHGNELIEATWAGDEAGVRAAFQKGAAVDSRYVDLPCRYGQTALMAASFEGHDRIVRLLLDRGVSVNMEYDGYTALHYAVLKGHESVIQMLVGADARHDASKLRLAHLLVRAACKGFKMRAGDGFPPSPGAVEDADSAPTIVEVLGRGADVNATDPRGFTPLMYAANLGLIENVRALVAAGADIAAQAKDGSTALSLASQSGASYNQAERREIVEFLRKRSPAELPR